MWLIEAKELTLKVSGRALPIFEKRTLTLGEDERIALTGPSGVGKTLFLRSLCFLECFTGEICWKGQSVSDSEVPFYRARVMYVGQKSILPPGTVETAFQEVFRLKVHQQKKWNCNQTLEALQFLGKPRDFLTRRIEQLSGGEKQIVNILRSLALEPRVLCLDEPTSALDSESTLKLESWLRENYTGAWLWVTHQKDQAERVGKSQLVF